MFSNKPVEIFKDIFMLKGINSANMYYFNFRKKALIDTGHPDEIKKNIKVLNKTGFDVKRLDYVLNTHSHGDHIGGNAYLKNKNPALKIIASEFYDLYCERKRSLNILKGAEIEFEPYNVDIAVKDGDIIDLDDFKLTVLEAKGHSIDSISFFDTKNKLLFSGDCIYPKVITQIDYYQDLGLSLDELAITYNKINALGVKAIYTGHSEPITEIDKNMKYCINKLERFRNNIELAIINNFIPSIEFYLYQNKNVTIDIIVDYMVVNMMKFSNNPCYRDITKEKFIEIVNKMISLMQFLKIIDIKGRNIYLKHGVNVTIRN